MNDCAEKTTTSLGLLMSMIMWSIYAFGVYALFVVIVLGAIAVVIGAVALTIGMCWAVKYMGYGVWQSIRAKWTGETPMISNMGFVAFLVLLVPPIVYAVLLYNGTFGDLGLNSGQ